MTQHASTPPPPGASEPGHAERVKTLLRSERLGTLATQSVRHPGWPFASVMPYVLLDDSSPLFLISTMAIHTKNVLADGRASLLVMESGDADPLSAPRGTIIGTVSRIEQPSPAVRELYLERHPAAKNWIDYSDFGFFRLEVSEVYFVGGFGVMGWVAARDYVAADADPLMDAEEGIIKHMNEDHHDALRSIAKHFAGLEADDATMISCDRLGFVIRARTTEGMKGARIAFEEPVTSREDARRALVAMTKKSRGE